MNEPELRRLLPHDKMDTRRARALVALGYPAVEPVLADIVAWLLDMNWPVAQVLVDLVISIGMPVVPYLKPVLTAEQEDDIWKYWIVSSVLRNSPELSQALLSDLHRMAYSATPTEKREEVDMVAREVLAEMRFE